MKSYRWIFDSLGSVPLIPVLFRGQLYQSERLIRGFTGEAHAFQGRGSSFQTRIRRKNKYEIPRKQPD